MWLTTGRNVLLYTYIKVNTNMKTILTIAIASILLAGCSIPKNPKVSWGKKCAVQGNQVVWSHLWIYDKNQGLDATKENCKLIAD